MRKTMKFSIKKKKSTKLHISYFFIFFQMKRIEQSCPTEFPVMAEIVCVTWGCNSVVDYSHVRPWAQVPALPK
jgi:hypothetical protein